MKIILVFLFSVSVVLQAQEFKSLKAKEALSAYNAELKKIDDLQNKAKEKYKKELTEAMNIAMKSGNLEESVLINSVLESDFKNEDKTNETKSKSKLKEPIVLTDAHGSWTHVKDVNPSNNNTYKFDVQTLGKKYTLKFYFESKSFDMEVLMTGGKQTLLNIGALKQEDYGASIDVSAQIKTKGVYSFLPKIKKPDLVQMSKAEMVIE